LIALLHLFTVAGVDVEFCTEEGSNRYAFLKVYLTALREIDDAGMSSRR
jgi:hypothetical protein